MANTAIHSVRLWRLDIPMRGKVAHAAHERKMADPIVCAVELNTGTIGWGETLPRPYVTGETHDSVHRTIERLYCPTILDICPDRFPDALEAIDNLPWQLTGHGDTPAARSLIELALLDAYARHFRKDMSEIPGWMGYHAFGLPGSIRTIRHAGVLASSSIEKMMKHAHLFWWYGIRDFKLKVGGDDDHDRVTMIANYLRPSLATDRATLRLDANGAWTLDQAADRLSTWKSIPIAAIEQPLAKDCERDLSELRACVMPPLFYDESLITMNDAKRLIDLGVAGGFNIRISKCGGLLPSLRLADLARKNGITIQLGCMVGETSILSAVGRRFLELVPDVRFAEGSFGSLLLKGDVVRRPLRFGYGGRVKPISGLGWGVDVDESLVDRYAADKVEFIL